MPHRIARKLADHLHRSPAKEDIWQDRKEPKPGTVNCDHGIVFYLAKVGCLGCYDIGVTVQGFTVAFISVVTRVIGLYNNPHDYGHETRITFLQISWKYFVMHCINA